MTPKEERVWQHLLRNRQAPTHAVAAACDVDVGFVENLISRISSPNWREPVRNDFAKSDGDKPRMDLIPPEAMWALAEVLALGAAKYCPRNWEVGADWGRYYAALLRHLTAWWGGEDNDPETGRPHTWHALCCLAFLVAYEQRDVGTDDRPNKKDRQHAGMVQEEGPDPKVA